ncbi:hypothetical protein Sjap_022252 [Stephania japonica]|uniref:ZC3H15/TMA46 family C-terminal domain-containing protein n=1 Tax=Stephania japonica TaxID=461633 RepID=A0AAP0ER65_9MAGN
MGAEEELKEKEGRPTTTTETIITHSQFLSWKRQKDADVVAKKEEVARKRQEDIVAGLVPMNGRELFLHEPWVFDNTRF